MSVASIFVESTARAEPVYRAAHRRDGVVRRRHRRREIPILLGDHALQLRGQYGGRRDGLVGVLERPGVDDLGLERLHQNLHAAADRIDARHDLIDVRGGDAGGDRIPRRVVLGRGRHRRRQCHGDVTEDADRLDCRDGALRHLVLVFDLNEHVEIAGASQVTSPT